MASGEEEETIFDKLSEAFQTAIQGMKDLLTYFENVLKKCVNSIAIMIVTSFVLPLLTLFLFRWLLNELFSLNLPKPHINFKLPKGKRADEEIGFKIEDKGEETRKLIVSTQEATVSTELSDRLIQKIDFDFLKKTQKVSYTGTGYFVVDLDNLTKQNIVWDKENKVITIKIGHAYLQAIEIDPDKIIVDEVKRPAGMGRP